MSATINIESFSKASLPQKLTFFSTEIGGLISAEEEKSLNKFLRSIILDVQENNYIRKRAMEVFTNCVFLSKLKVRSALVILIDEWPEEEEIYLEIRRLKDLFLFYNEERDEIENIYVSRSDHSQAEIGAEARYCLGLIEFQKALSCDSMGVSILKLNQSKIYFDSAISLIENRTDASFFSTAISVLISLLNGQSGDTPRQLKVLSNILFSREMFSISSSSNSFQISFFRTLSNFYNMKNEPVSSWLDIRKGFDRLLDYFNEIMSVAVDVRLNQQALTTEFKNFAELNLVKPYFAINFSAEIDRINARLSENDLTPAKRDFLENLKLFASDVQVKKKADTQGLIELLRKALPERLHSINEVIGQNENITVSFFNEIYDSLNRHSLERFVDVLLNACMRLQGFDLLRAASEDQRNSYISTLLEKSAYRTKDQTRWSKSACGKSDGEIDIFVYESDGSIFTIIEALILSSLDKSYLSLHLNKLFGYDVNGLKQNFLLIYSSARNFSGLWEKYIAYIKIHSFEHPLVEFKIVESLSHANLKVGISQHLRNNTTVFLYHFMIDMART